MSFKADNRAFETWLKQQCDVVADDLKTKHKHMKRDSFVFLRATFFRWARRIETICPGLADAPAVLSVGDAHIENFGTWRDAEGRLVWGVNDFDEAAVIAWPYDLVRLATSARLAPGRVDGMTLVAAAILEGYRDGLADARPTLLDEQESWMRPFVACSHEDRARFWQKVKDYDKATPPKSVTAGLRRSLPEDARKVRFARRFAGAGSRGRPRFVAVAHWRGGRLVREAKALVPSAWDWARGADDGPIRFLELARGKHRAPDPTLAVGDGFVFRRLAADARKIELPDGAPFSLDVVRAMGFEIGTIHAADKRAGAVKADLKRRPPRWLHKAAKAAAADVEADYKAWKS